MLVQCVGFVFVAQLFFSTFAMKEATVIVGSSARFNKFSEFILASQQRIIKQLETEDGKEVFLQDVWQKGESVSCTNSRPKTIDDRDHAKAWRSRSPSLMQRPMHMIFATI